MLLLSMEVCEISYTPSQVEASFAVSVVPSRDVCADNPRSRALLLALYRWQEKGNHSATTSLELWM
jgi:hypothetical protein